MFDPVDSRPGSPVLNRIVTLRHAAALYRKEPDNFLMIEVYV